MRYPLLVCLLLADPPRPAEPSPEAVKLFGTRVQPVLMNSCASCHSAGKCGTFELKHVRPGVTVHPAIAQFNLAAAVGQVNRVEPAISPLLQKALAAHGGMKVPAFKDANAPAYKHLEQWAKLLAADGVPANITQPAEATPAGPGPKDEFDPAIFNAATKG